MITPVAVLVYCAACILRPGTDLKPTEMAHLGAIALVALINLKLSYDLGHDLLAWLYRSLQNWRDWFPGMRTVPRPDIRTA